MKILAITQARYGSTRLPAKILKEIKGQTLLEIHLRRILQARRISGLKIATTAEEGARHILAVAEKVGIGYCQGSVEDVLDRFYASARPERPDYVVRLTSDCPFIDPQVIDDVIDFALQSGCDYAATDPDSFPDGLDTEVFRFSALERAWKEASLTSEREHVTPYIWKNGSAKGGTIFDTRYLPCPEGNFGAYRITLDTPADFQVIERLVTELGTDRGWKDYVDYLALHPDIRDINGNLQRNEGYAKSIDNDTRAK